MKIALTLLLTGFGIGFFSKTKLVKAKINTFQRVIAGLNLKIDSISQDLNMRREDTEKLRRENTTLRKENASIRRKNDRLRSENDTLRWESEEQREEREKRRRHYQETDISDTENQIKFISQAELRAIRPVNNEAVQVLYALEKWIKVNQPRWRVSFEVSMGAFIKTSYDPGDWIQQAAFSSYNSKRVDFLLIDGYGEPQFVVEYNGTGHDLSKDALDRMKVKRLALAQVGIPLIEIPAKTSQPDILKLIAEQLDAPLAMEHS